MFMNVEAHARASLRKLETHFVRLKAQISAAFLVYAYGSRPKQDLPAPVASRFSRTAARKRRKSQCQRRFMGLHVSLAQAV
jgi:hypothetical protein